MNIQETFSEEQWKQIAMLPQLVGGATAAAGSSGIFGSLKEAMASVKGIMDGANSYDENPMIKAIAPDLQKKEETRAKMTEQKEALMAKIKGKEVKNGAELTALALEESAKVAAILDEVDVPMELSLEFKEWVVAIAKNVSEAAKEGSFFGFGGTRVSEEEESFIADLTIALGM